MTSLGDKRPLYHLLLIKEITIMYILRLPNDQKLGKTRLELDYINVYFKSGAILSL